eukprot:TRINITY_DN18428_c0_g1_i1.p1 TRINITY_DN18428_c0_g1~~TRINITY_DN18428_c0_g1_i1.p1  ORF type:complete len:450 (+),score=91.52 TRINITY_DN18428_c0_g1_i1:38-1351(+)
MMIMASGRPVAVLLLLLRVCCLGATSPYFLVFGDTHLDTRYQAGAKVNCPIYNAVFLPCCHNTSTGTGAAGMFGEKQCDAPTALLEGVLQAGAGLFPDPDFVMFVGDITPHTDVTAFPSLITESWQRLYDAMDNAFPTTTPLYSVMGNHDTFPIDEFSPARNSKLLQDTVQQWSRRLTDTAALETAKVYGYYSTVPSRRTGLRIIALNTNFYLSGNIEVDKNDTDPGEQRGWLEATIQQAEANGEKVWVLGHGAPNGNSRTNFTEYFNNLLASLAEEKSPALPQTQFYGHTHIDELLLPRAAVGSAAVSVMRIVPLSSHYNGLWPTLREYTYDPATLELIDEFTYHVNVSRANEEGAVTLELFYSSRDTYGMQNLSPASWDVVVDRMRTDEATAQTYIHLRGTNPEAGLSPCNEDCRKQLYCSVAYTTNEERAACMQ